jgi:hypothetical protein
MIKLLMQVLEVINIDLNVASESLDEVVSLNDLFLKLTYLLPEVNVFFHKGIVLLFHAIKYLLELFHCH